MDQAYNAGPPRSAQYEDRKIFVGALSWETTEESLQKYFENFGEVESAVVMKDPTSKQPRGFGFVTFVDNASVGHVLRYTEKHVIDKKQVDPKPAQMKGHLPPASGNSGGGRGGGGGGGGGDPSTARKIFLGGLPTNISQDTVRDYFTSLNVGATVAEVELKYDNETNRMRGFGFVTFENEEVAARMVQMHYHTISGKSVEAKKAESRGASSGKAGGINAQQQQMSAQYHQANALQRQAGHPINYSYPPAPTSYDQFYNQGAYANYYYQGGQQQGAPPQQMAAAYRHGQDTSRSGYSTANNAAYSGYHQTVSTYDTSQTPQVAQVAAAGMPAAYQQQSYSTNQPSTANYGQPTGQQYYQ